MGPNKSRAALARDAALERISRTRRWMVVGAAALTAGFAALVSAVAPGRSLASKSPAKTEASTATSPTRSGSSGSSIPRMPAPANPGDLGLQGPDQAPSSPPEDPSQSQSAPSPDPSQPSQPQPQSVPTPAPAPPVVSGGS